MTTYLTSVSNRIPLPVRRFWRAGGPFVVLALSILGLWLGDGELYVQRYINATNGLDAAVKQRMAESSGYAAGYTISYVVVRLFIVPLQVLPWLGLVWSLGAITFWMAFRAPDYQPAATVKFSPWFNVALVMWAIWLNLANLLAIWIGPNDVNEAISTWILVWCLGYTLWMYFRDTRRIRRQLTGTATQAELTALKAQINPHFLFNSLNNIFGTALTEGGQRTPEGVQQLSGLLRYQLEKTQVEAVDMATELRFLDDYVQFHRQLLPNAVVHQYDWDEQPARIAPLLLTPLIDYALQQQATDSNVPVQSRLTVKDRFLSYRLTYPVRATPPPADALDNVRQRLTTLYPTTYTLNEATANRIGKLDLTILL